MSKRWSWTGRVGVGLAAGALLVTLSSTTAGASSSVTVTCGTETGNLQTAIDNAAAGTTIHILGTCFGGFYIDKNLTLVGGTLDGSNQAPGPDFGSEQVLYIANGTVHLNSVTIQNGFTDEGGGLGIGFSATVTLLNTTVKNNAAGEGGGIFNQGVLTLNGSNVVSNQALEGEGGGIYSQGAVTVISSLISQNTASGAGGGVALGEGPALGSLILKNSTISLNTGDEGGGIFNDNTITILSSTISRNHATDGNGGGIDNIGIGTITINKCTMQNNTSTSYGGAIANDGNSIDMSTCVLSGNTATFGGGGIYNAASLTLHTDSITANKVTSSEGDGGGILQDGSITGLPGTNIISGNTPDDVS